ncbi:TPA: GFA family protein [Streptococcus suis]|nr:GFA family protein [Streptococcus suis]
MVYCHCSFCRKATTSAFSITAMVDRKAVTI